MSNRQVWFGVWLDLGEWLGSTACATKPDALHKNTAMLGEGRKQAQRRLSSAAKKATSIRPAHVALWSTRAGAAAEIAAFEPERFERGAEAVRVYGRLSREELIAVPGAPHQEAVEAQA